MAQPEIAADDELAVDGPVRRLTAIGASRCLAARYVRTVIDYSVTIRPEVRSELARWRKRAEQIPDRTLRSNALVALGKKGNMEGAALFSLLAPRRARERVLHTLIAFQMAYTYLDVVGEQISPQPIANGRRLHSALLAALDPGMAHEDYYALHPQRDDGGYLIELIEACRAGVATLPSFELVTGMARDATSRIVEFQGLNVGERQGSSEGLERWAREQPTGGAPLSWWESAAAGGSSLAVHVALALAADPELDEDEVRATERAYHPIVGALHSLLDSVVDVAEDERDGQRNLLRYYACAPDAHARLGELAAQARSQMGGLPRGRWHEVMLSLMISHYLSARELRGPDARAVARRVSMGAGKPTQLTLALFKGARLISRSSGV